MLKVSPGRTLRCNRSKSPLARLLTIALAKAIPWRWAIPLMWGDRRSPLPLGLVVVLIITAGCGRPQGSQDTATHPPDQSLGSVTAPPTGQGQTPIDPPRPSTLISQRSGAQINIRSTPATTAPVIAQGQSGDGVQLLWLTEAEDGYTWYQVRLQPSGQQGWVRGDLVGPIGAIAANPPQAATPGCETDRQQARFETQSFTVYICQGSEGLRYVSIDKAQQTMVVSQEVIHNHDTYIAIDGDRQYHLSDHSLGVYQVNNGHYSQLMAETVLRSEQLVY